MITRIVIIKECDVLSRIDLNLLKTLSLLLDTKSVTATARQMGTSQPSVSRSLAQLRCIFDDPLLMRTGGGMEITKRGQELSDPLNDWLAATFALFTPPEFDPSNLSCHFRIATTDFGVQSVVAPALAHLRNQAPGFAIELMAFSGDMNAKLASGRLDLIITGVPPDPALVHQRYLFRETCCCLVHADHSIAGFGPAAPLPIDSYLAWPHLGIHVGEDSFDPINLQLGPLAARRNVIASMPYFQAIPLLLESTDAIATVPSRMAARLAAAESSIATVPGPEELPGFDYWITWHERSHRDAATRWLIDLFAEHSSRA